MERLDAKKAREILAKTKRHKEEVLEKIFNDIRFQAETGLAWCNINLDGKEPQSFIDDIRSELILLDYKLEKVGGASFQIQW